MNKITDIKREMRNLREIFYKDHETQYELMFQKWTFLLNYFVTQRLQGEISVDLYEELIECLLQLKPYYEDFVKPIPTGINEEEDNDADLDIDVQ